MLTNDAFTSPDVRTRFGRFQDHCGHAPAASADGRFESLYPQAFDWLFVESDPDAYEAGLWVLARVLNVFPEDFAPLLRLSIENPMTAEITLSLFSRLRVLHRDALLPEQFARLDFSSVSESLCGPVVECALKTLSQSPFASVSLAAGALLIQTGLGEGELFFSHLGLPDHSAATQIKDPLVRRRVSVLAGFVPEASSIDETFADADSLISSRLAGNLFFRGVASAGPEIERALCSDDPKIVASVLHGFRVYSDDAKRLLSIRPLVAELLERHVQSHLRFIRNPTIRSVVVLGETLLSVRPTVVEKLLPVVGRGDTLEDGLLFDFFIRHRCRMIAAGINSFLIDERIQMHQSQISA